MSSSQSCRLRSLSTNSEERPDSDVIVSALRSRYMIIALRNIITSNVRLMPSSKLLQDVRSIANAAVSSRPELLVEALALVLHACPDGVSIASGLRKLAFDEYIKNCDTDSLVRLLELECSSSATSHREFLHGSQSSRGIGDALSLCISVLGQPGDLSDGQVNPDVELVLIESVSIVALVFCVDHFSHVSTRCLAYAVRA
jgi:hypothetical protein